MNLKQLTDKPIKTTVILAVLLFWLLTPLIAQKYYNMSAINTSFAIIIIYYVIWKLYNHRSRVSNII